jgi:hypothetical protein
MGTLDIRHWVLRIAERHHPASRALALAFGQRVAEKQTNKRK